MTFLWILNQTDMQSTKRGKKKVTQVCLFRTIQKQQMRIKNTKKPQSWQKKCKFKRKIDLLKFCFPKNLLESDTWWKFSAIWVINFKNIYIHLQAYKDENDAKVLWFCLIFN